MAAVGTKAALSCSTPPVSINRNKRPFHDTVVSSRSRVVPAIGETSARGLKPMSPGPRPAKRLNNVDFPAFGAPKMATVGGGNDDMNLRSDSDDGATLLSDDMFMPSLSGPCLDLILIPN